MQLYDLEMKVRGFLYSVVLMACLLVGQQNTSQADSASTIVMLTWRGQTAAEVRFIETLEKSGRGIQLVQFDAGRDRSALADFLRKNIATLRSADGIYTFGTLTARVVQNLGLKDVPHVFNIVADPVGAGLVKDLAKPGVPRTGAKNTVPLKSTFALLSQAVEFASVAIVFDPRELTTVAQFNEASVVIEAMGKQAKGVRFVPDAENAGLQTRYLAEQLSDVDLVYVPAGSSLVTHMQSIVNATPENAIIVGAVETQAHKGATIAIGTDYSERGKVAAEMMLTILDGADPATMPVSEVSIADAKIVINLSAPRSARRKEGGLKGKVVPYGDPWDSKPVAER